MRARLSYGGLGAALALLAFSATSPALLEEPAAVAVTPYGLMLALAALAGVMILEAEQRGDPGALPRAPRAGALLILAGLAGARLMYCFARASYYMGEVGAWHILALREGGYLLYGALLGMVCAVAACTHARETSGSGRLGAALDDLALPSLTVLALARLAEGLAGEGLGNWVENEALWRLPFAAQNVYGEYQWALFIPEAAAALLILAVVSRKKAGRAQTALLLYAASQIVFESLRMDSVLKIGFVRVSQVLSAAVILVILLIRTRALRGGQRAGALLLFACCVGGIGGIEWALDKTPLDNRLLYGCMAALCAVLAWNGRERARPAKG